MKTVRDPQCRSCNNSLVPLWKSQTWRCVKCGLEQSLPESKKVVDNWDKQSYNRYIAVKLKDKKRTKMLQTSLHLQINSIAKQAGVMPTYWSAISFNCDRNEPTGMRVLLT